MAFLTKQRLIQPTQWLLVIVLALAAQSAIAASLSEIQDRGTIRIGILGTVPPFGVFNNQGNIEGFDVDLATRLAEELGVELEVVNTTATNRIPYLQSGKVDLVVGTFSRTLKRERVVDFSVPYAIAGPVVVASKSLEGVSSIKDLAGMSVGTIPGIVGDIWARKLQPDANYTEYSNEADQLLALRTGKVDAIVQDITIANTYVNKYPEQLKVVGEPFYRDFLAIGIPQGQTELKNWVDWYVFQMFNLGYIQELWKEYFDYPMPNMKPNPFF